MPTKNPKPNQNENPEQVGRDPYYSDIPEWLQEFRENLVDDRVLEHRDSHASSSHESSLEAMRSVDLGKHSVKTHLPKDRNREICQRTKNTRAPCRRRNGGVVLRAKNFGDLITADHKVLSASCESRNNHRYAIVVQDMATQWIQSYPCKSSWSQIGSLKSFTMTIPWHLAKFVKIFPGIIVRRHTQMTNGIAEIAERRVKEGTSAVLSQSGSGGQIPWNGLPFCETFKISCLMGRYLMKDALENLVKDQSFRSVHWLIITLSLRKTS